MAGSAVLPSITLSGHITGADGASIAGATVQLAGTSQGVTTTDAAGNYSFPDRAPGSYSIQPSRTDCTFTPNVVNLNNASSNQAQDFTGSGPACGGALVTSTTTGPLTISGQVSDPSGAGVAGQLVHLDGSLQAVQITDASGSYAFNVPAGSYSLRTTGTGCAFTPDVVNLNNLSASVTQDFQASSAGAAPRPILECVTGSDSSFTAVFGYQNSACSRVSTPIGAQNQFTPGPANQGQPDLFEPGTHDNAIAVPFDGSALSWTLDGVTVTASQSSPRCAGSNAGLTGGTPLAGSGRLMVGPDVLALPPVPETTFPGPGDTGNGDEDDDDVPPPPSPTGAPALPSGEDDPGLPQTQVPSVSVEATGNLSDWSGFPADTNLAVSHTHVVVTARDAVGVYKRVNPGPSEGSPTRVSVTSTRTLFGGFQLTTTYPSGHWFDTRSLFDPFRNRFYVVALYNTKDPAIGTLYGIAVSTDETASSFFTWYTHAHGSNFQNGDGSDFPSIGISKSAFVVTSKVSGTSRSYIHALLLSPDDLVAGKYWKDVRGWQYWDLVKPDGGALRNILQPAVHHTDDGTTWLASNAGGSGPTVLWRVSNFLRANQSVAATAVAPIQPFVSPVDAPQNNPPMVCGPSHDAACTIRMTNLGNNILHAVFRSGRLYLTANDARDWLGTGVESSNRVMRFNVASFPSVTLEIERTFGSNNVFEDPPDSKFFYAWSAVEVNKDGDMAIVYTRSGTTIFPEARFSVFLASEPDIRSSRILKAGEDSYQVGATVSKDSIAWGDQGGASVDPVDDTSIWLAQQYANSRHKNSGNGNYSIFVGKVTF